jgi:4-aminobutyrate aminotransferase
VIERDEAVVTPAIYRYTNIAFERAEGVYLYDFDGRRYLDFVAGIATMNVGHGHPAVKEAILDQVEKLVHGACHVGYMEPYVAILEAIKAIAPGPLRDGKGVLMNSGSEAVETAVKLARYVKNRPMILAFTDSFHGRPMGALALTATSPIYRHRLTSLLTGVYHVPYPNPFRCPTLHDSPEMCSKASLNLVEKALQSVVPPQDCAGIIVEPIAGEGGYIVPPDGFLSGLRDICDRHDLLFIADEVQTGLGRTGKWFATEHWNVQPDIVALGKALGGGFPLGGVLARRELMDAWPPAAHGTTFGGNPVACRAGMATLDVMRDEGLLAHAIQVGDHIQSRFRAAQEGLPIIGDVRGKGLMVGVELVNADGSPAAEITKPVIKEIAQAGLALTKCGPSALRIAPPLVITQEQAEEGVAIILGVLSRHQW